jgi:hypothetical protein
MFKPKTLTISRHQYEVSIDKIKALKIVFYCMNDEAMN